jgi:hypothetical protein
MYFSLFMRRSVYQTQSMASSRLLKKVCRKGSRPMLCPLASSRS